MSKRFFGILLILLLPLASSPIDKKKKAYELIYQDVQLLKQQFLKLNEKIDRNAGDINFIKGQLKELLNLVKLFLTNQAGLKEDKNKASTRYQVLLERLEAMNLQLIKFSEELMGIKRTLTVLPEQEEEIAKGEKSPPPKEQKDEGQKEKPSEEELLSPPPSNLSPREVFQTAYSDYRKGSYPLAIKGFEMYKRHFPDTPLTDDALYWIGECYFSQRQFQEAISEFDELILNYTHGDKVPAAYLKKGLSLMELKKNEEALAVFKILISKYPLEEETKIAQQKIKDLTSENEGY